jgi:phage terminase Nu1 subunit (DNA packaging protein)
VLSLLLPSSAPQSAPITAAEPTGDAIGATSSANKKELAAVIGCSLPTLSAWIDHYGDAFPVSERGTNGREWRFDPAEVIGFLRARRADEERAVAEQAARLQQFALPGLMTPGEIEGVSKPSDLLALARARQISRREQSESALLVRTDEVRSALAGHLTRLDRWAADVLTQIAGKHGWAASVLAEARAMFGEGRLAFVRDVGTYAPEGAEQSGDLLRAAHRAAPSDDVAP